METKFCPHCQTEKPKGEFGKHHRQKDGLQSWCKRCISFHNKAQKSYASPAHKKYYQDHRDELVAYKREWYQKNRARIRGQFKDKYWTDPENHRAIGRQDYQKRRGKILQYQQRYLRDNRDKVLDYHRQYAKQNKDKIGEYVKNRYRNDLSFRILMNCRNRMRFYLKGKKSDTTRNLIGCSVDELRAYLESKFTPNMNWDNYGTYWHIDHIVPCAAFDMTKEEQQRVCFNWRNLQPLEGSENNRKNDLLPDGTRARHRKKGFPNNFDAILK